MDKLALSFHIRMITVQFTGQKKIKFSCFLWNLKINAFTSCASPAHLSHSTDVYTKVTKMGRDLGICQSAQLLCKSPVSFKWFDIAWWSIFFLEICFGSSLLWKKLTHLTFWWVWGRRRRRPWWWRRWPGWWRRRGGRSRRPARRRNPLKARQLAPAKPFFHQL